MSSVVEHASLHSHPAAKPDLEVSRSLGGAIAFLGVLLAGVAYMGYSVYADVQEAHR